MKTKKLLILFVILLLTACNTEPEVIKETVIVKQTIEVEKTVKETVIVTEIVEIEKIVTNTPIPATATPIPSPTAIGFDPIHFTGSGNKIIDFDKPDLPAIVTIAGNLSGSHFSVSNYDNTGNQIGLLVNTTNIYVGNIPLDFNTSDNTTRLEIKAKGEWDIEIKSLSQIDVKDISELIEGNIDHIFKIEGGIPDKAIITGNASGYHFAIKAYDKNTKMLSLLVNTTEPYEGEVLIPQDTTYIEVITPTDNDWTIDITSK